VGGNHFVEIIPELRVAGVCRVHAAQPTRRRAPVLLAPRFDLFLALLLLLSRHVQRKGAAPLSGTEEQTARAISAHAQCAFLLSLQMRSIN
jgi:hypothetical protein